MSDEQHLKHKMALFSEAKDEFLNHEISYEAYVAKARPLWKEIRALEKKLAH